MRNQQAKGSSPPTSGLGLHQMVGVTPSELPTVVTIKSLLMDDSVAVEPPAFSSMIAWPRLASLLTLAIWSVEWPRTEKIEQLPSEVDKCIHGTAYLDPKAIQTRS